METPLKCRRPKEKTPRQGHPIERSRNHRPSGQTGRRRWPSIDVLRVRCARVKSLFSKEEGVVGTSVLAVRLRINSGGRTNTSIVDNDLRRPRIHIGAGTSADRHGRARRGRREIRGLWHCRKAQQLVVHLTLDLVVRFARSLGDLCANFITV